MSFLAHHLLKCTHKPDPIFVGGTTYGYTGSSETVISLTSLTGGVDTSPQKGDLVIVSIAAGQLSASPVSIGSSSSGYTEIVSDTAQDASDVALTISYKMMNETPDTNVYVNGAGTNSTIAVAIHVWRNINKIDIIDTSPNVNPVLNTIIPNPPSISVSLYSIGIAVGAGGGGTQDYSSPDLENFITHGQNSSYDSTIGMGSLTNTTVTFDPAQFSYGDADSTNYAAIGVSLSLKRL